LKIVKYVNYIDIIMELNMKKILILLLISTSFSVFAMCPTPDNLDYRTGLTALHVASGRGDKDKVYQLLKKGASPDLQDFTNGYTALHWAIVFGHKAIVKLLLQNGADPTIKDENGLTAIQKASELSNLGIIKIVEEAYIERLGK